MKKTRSIRAHGYPQASHRLAFANWLRLSPMLLLVLSCNHTSRLSPLETLNGLARNYVRLAVALGERDLESLDYYNGPLAAVADLRSNPPPFAEIKRAALQAAGELDSTPFTEPVQKQRAAFLVRQLRALAVRVDILTIGQQQNEMPFDRESEGLLGITIPPTYDKQRLAAVRAEIARLLGPGPGSLAARYATFDQRFTIPPARIPAVMTHALQACRSQTVTHIPLPAGESISLEYTTNQPWSAFSRYQGNLHSLIQINTGFALTVDRALQLACHEGYPGHHTFNSIRDATLVRATQWPELTVQTTFSPQSLVSEAAATYATQLAFPDAQRLELERTELFPLAGLDPNQAERYLRIQRLVDQLHVALPSIARNFLDHRYDHLEATRALEDETLMAHAGATLDYLNEYRSYVLTYTYGLDLVAAYIEGPTPESTSTSERWSRYLKLMNSPGTALHGLNAN